MFAGASRAASAAQVHRRAQIARGGGPRRSSASGSSAPGALSRGRDSALARSSAARGARATHGGARRTPRRDARPARRSPGRDARAQRGSRFGSPRSTRDVRRPMRAPSQRRPPTEADPHTRLRLPQAPGLERVDARDSARDGDTGSAIARLREFGTLLLAMERRCVQPDIAQRCSRMVERHFTESLEPAHWLKAGGAKRWLDLGSGGGFPAIPLAILGVGGHWTLVESRRNKTLFLQKAVQELKLSGLEVVREQHRESSRSGVPMSCSTDSLRARQCPRGNAGSSGALRAPGWHRVLMEGQSARRRDGGRRSAGEQPGSSTVARRRDRPEQWSPDSLENSCDCLTNSPPSFHVEHCPCPAAASPC